jgi:hypothetical protein
MTSLGAAPELVPPGLAPRQNNPLTPPPTMMGSGMEAGMDAGHTALADSLSFEEDVLPPPGHESSPAASESANQSKRDPAPSASPRSASPSEGTSTSAALESLRHELGQVGMELGTFSGTLTGLVDRVERLERALDAATGDLESVAEAIRGPDAAVLKELQGILADIEHGTDGGSLDEAVKVLEQLASHPRDIELLLKLSQQAGAIESALRIHGRLVAAAPRLRTTLARLTD